MREQARKVRARPGGSAEVITAAQFDVEQVRARGGRDSRH
jgi:hypothetical protein